jgi:dTDP-4-amino-4,6-dideoxygalactose transaminase
MVTENKNMKVPFAIPELGDEEIEEVADVIKSGWLTTASRCARFEEEFCIHRLHRLHRFRK